MPEHSIDSVLDDGVKPCATVIVEHRSDAKILFNDVSLFGDRLVAGNLDLSKGSVDFVFTHDAIGNFVNGDEISIRLARIAFIGINHLDF